MRKKKSNTDKWLEIKSNPEKLKYFRRNFVKNGLRRLSYRWFGRFNALAKSKLDRNEYICNLCGIITGKKNIQLDHKIPVVDLAGWKSFDDFIEKLFCVESGFSVLCKSCHNEKTESENIIRRKNNKRIRKKKKIDKSKKK